MVHCATVTFIKSQIASFINHFNRRRESPASPTPKTVVTPPPAAPAAPASSPKRVVKTIVKEKVQEEEKKKKQKPARRSRASRVKEQEKKESPRKSPRVCEAIVKSRRSPASRIPNAEQTTPKKPVPPTQKKPVSPTQKKPKNRIMLTFKVGDKVFGKVKGYPAWPARITAVNGKKYSVIFYGTNETATLKQEQIVFYLVNKAKYGNARRKYFPEAIQDIELDIEQSGGVDGNPNPDRTPTAPTTPPPTNPPTRSAKAAAAAPPAEPPIVVAAAAPTANKPVKRKRQSLPPASSSTPEPSDSLPPVKRRRQGVEKPAGDVANIEDQNHNVPPVEEKKSSERSTASTIDNLAEEETTSTSETLETTTFTYKRSIPSTILERTENETSNASKHDPASLRDTNADDSSKIGGGDNAATLPPLSKEAHSERKLNVDEELKASRCVEEMDVKDVHLLPEFYLATILKYKERLEDRKHYYKTVSPDAEPQTYDTSNDSVITVVPVRIAVGRYAGLIYTPSEPAAFRCEYDRAAADAQLVQELLEIKAELEVHNLNINDARYIRHLKDCDEETAAAATKNVLAVYESAKVAWLSDELALFGNIRLVRRRLTMRAANVAEALEYLERILNGRIERVSLMKRPNFVTTVRHLCRYVGNAREWNMPAEKAREFEESAMKIRQLAGKIYDKMRDLFDYREDEDFVERFEKECEEFTDLSSDLHEGELFALCAEPRSRRAQMGIIYDQQVDLYSKSKGQLLTKPEMV